MTDRVHPYKRLPDKAFWRKSVASIEPADVDPTGVFNLQLNESSKVATAGSCFAQHIARHLKASGYNYFVVEDGHPILGPEVRARNQYGTFSARYGNIYTARQLKQLLDRAQGTLSPLEDFWVEEDGRVLDPYRPTIQPGGFSSVEEMHADRLQHLAAVTRMFEQLDVFVFTLGLTECWRSTSDGAVFPLCPGVEGGAFDPQSHEFYNQSAHEVEADLFAVRTQLKKMNPKAQIVLTVSPVPLMATAAPGAHVLSATAYSKAVLRVAAETMRLNFDDVHYFPSYEIITGSFTKGAYFASDLRSVTEAGVSHVMRTFLRRATGQTKVASGDESPSASRESRSAKATSPSYALVDAQRIVDVECDESALDRP
jgi:hypothetical protein